jgi:hypothetical protein
VRAFLRSCASKRQFRHLVPELPLPPNGLPAKASAPNQPGPVGRRPPLRARTIPRRARGADPDRRRGSAPARWTATAPDGARLSTRARQGADEGYRDAHAASGQAALDSRLAVAGSRVIMLVSGVPAQARLARRRGATRCCRHGATFLPVRSVADHPVAGPRVKGAPGDLLADNPPVPPVISLVVNGRWACAGRGA